ncbi:MAG: hypothetical protein WCK17_18415 [Verrucomicrobiota bacterium]
MSVRYLFCVALLWIPVNALRAADAVDALKEAQKPNILWLIAEDMSPHLGCYGEKAIETPNIDKLAAGGVVF